MRADEPRKVYATESAARALVPGFLVPMGIKTLMDDNIDSEDFDRFWTLLVALNGDFTSASLIARAGLDVSEIDKPIPRSVLEAMASVRYFGV